MQFILFGVFLVLAVAFFFLTVRTAKSFYEANPAGKAHIHWIGQIKHLLKNWKPEYIRLAVFIAAFAGFYIAAMVLFRKIAKGA